MPTHVSRRGVGMSTATRVVEPLTDQQVAKWLGVNAKTLAKWRSSGYGPKAARFGRSVRYYPEDVEEFIRESKETKTAAGPEGAGGTLALPVQNQRVRVQRKYRTGGHRTTRERRAGNPGRRTAESPFRELDSAGSKTAQ
jgi:predicted DNA-binding transcriptional regulator AlpA